MAMPPQRRRNLPLWVSLLLRLELVCANLCLVAVSAFVAPSPLAPVLTAATTTAVSMTSSASDAASSLTETSGRVYRNVKAVLFDIDGTLADSWKLGYDATVKVLKSNGVENEITEEQYHDFTRYCTPERFARHVGLQPGDDDFDVVGDRLGHEFDTLYVDLVDINTAGFYPGVQKLLDGIPESVKFGALTNACVAYAHAVLRENGASERFGSAHGADSVPKPKPAPDGLLQVCKDLGVQPKDCVYIGDSPSDAGAAKNAGMPSIGVMWGSHSEESLKSAPFAHYCKSVDELAALLPIVEQVQR